MWLLLKQQIANAFTVPIELSLLRSTAPCLPVCLFVLRENPEAWLRSAWIKLKCKNFPALPTVGSTHAMQLLIQDCQLFWGEVFLYAVTCRRENKVKSIQYLILHNPISYIGTNISTRCSPAIYICLCIYHIYHIYYNLFFNSTYLLLIFISVDDILL